MRVTTISVAIALSIAASGFSQKQPHSFLKTVGGFSDAELAKLDGGAVITKTLASSANNELALLGAARVKGTIQAFLELYRDIETFEAELGTARMLSAPPKMSDLQGLEFNKSDVKALEHCEVGECTIKIGAEALKELKAQIDWSSPGAHDAVVRFLRERVLEYAKAYTEGGNASLAAYRNKSKPQYVAKRVEAGVPSGWGVAGSFTVFPGDKRLPFVCGGTRRAAEASFRNRSALDSLFNPTPSSISSDSASTGASPTRAHSSPGYATNTASRPSTASSSPSILR